MYILSIIFFVIAISFYVATFYYAENSKDNDKIAIIKIFRIVFFVFLFLGSAIAVAL